MEALLIKQPYSVSFSQNPLPFVIALTPYSDSERNQDIRLQVRIMIEQTFGSNIYSEVESQDYYPSNDGLFNFDISGVVDPYLDFYTPKPSLQKVVEAVGQRKRYKIAWLLMRDNTVVQPLQESTAAYVLKGGMAYEQWHPSEFFSNAIITQKNGLKFDPTAQKTFLDDLRYFFWTHPNTQADVAALITVYDEENNQVTNKSMLLNCNQWGVYCVPIGLNQLGIAIPAGVTAVKYLFNISQGGTQIINPIMFYIDHRNFYNTYQILYRNSVGDLETIRLRGQVDWEADYDRQAANRTVPPSYYSNLNLLPANIQSSSETEKFKGDTGFMSKAAVEKLRDLFLSEELYEYKNGKLVPVLINTKNAKFFTNRDNLISVQLEWQNAFANDHYTPKTLMPQTRSCPALESFTVKQVSKNLLQVMWAMPIPYDKVEVQVTVGATTKTYFFSGNAGTIRQQFDNPPGTTSVTVKGRVVCDDEVDPASTGAFTTATVTVSQNSLPIAVDDVYSINTGYNSAVTLSGSVLANDYDPDGDAIEAVAASGSTAAGGAYSISAAGVVQYTPPSSSYAGTDSFNYNMREVGGATTVTAKVTINVGSASMGVFAKIVMRNEVHFSNGVNSLYSAEVWIDFFSNPAGTLPMDVTGLALTVNVHKNYHEFFYDGSSSDTDTDETYTPTGTKIKIYEGDLYQSSFDQALNTDQGFQLTYTLQPGTGYTVI